MKNKKSIIEKAIFVLVIVIIVTFGALVINRKESQIKQLSTETQNMGDIVEGRDSLLNELFASYNEIENNLTYIKQKRNQIELKKEDNSINQKESIIEDIILLDSLIEENNKKIKNLENRLYRSNIKLAAFKKKIDELNQNYEVQIAEVLQLRNSIGERDSQIVQLNTKVDDLKSDIELKEQSLAEKSEVISQQDKELNEAYLTYGTFKELKENGVVVKDNAILGIGGGKSIQGNFNKEYFVKLDIRETREIPLFSKKVNFISEHPDSSYSFKIDEGLITHLEIEDPDEFWKISKYAVIETKYRPNTHSIYS